MKNSKGVNNNKYLAPQWTRWVVEMGMKCKILPFLFMYLRWYAKNYNWFVNISKISAVLSKYYLMFCDFILNFIYIYICISVFVCVCVCEYCLGERKKRNNGGKININVSLFPIPLSHD